MIRFISLVLCFLVLLAPFSIAKDIKIKNNFFLGWRYSVDNGKFRGVGFGGGLANEMKDNDSAFAQMGSYKRAKVWSAVTGWPGGFLVGWAAGGAMAGRFEETEKACLAIGTPLCIVSLICEGAATKHLKKAVGIYQAANGQSTGTNLSLSVDRRTVAGGTRPTTLFCLNLRF